MLTGKQKRYLRSLAMTTKPLINVGKNGLGDTFVAGVKDALEARELVKISLLPAADDTPQEVADTLQAALNGLVLVNGDNNEATANPDNPVDGTETAPVGDGSAPTKTGDAGAAGLAALAVLSAGAVIVLKKKR